MGSYPFTVQVTDFAGNLSAQPLTVVVNMTQPSCADAVIGAVPQPILGGLGNSTTPGAYTTVSATFTPNNGMTLQQAEQACNVTGFNWMQQVTIPKPSPGWAINLSGPGGIPGIPTNVSGTSFDPPPNGGWTYEYYDPKAAHYGKGGDFAYPFYCDTISFGFGRCGQTVNTIEYFDNPTDFCLPNSDGMPSAAYTSNNKYFKSIRTGHYC